MPLFSALLVPVDGSEPSDAACTLAVKVAADQKAALTFVHVVETEKIAVSVAPGQGFADPMPAINVLRAAGDAVLKDAVKSAQNAGVAAQSQLVEGDSIESILSVAKDTQADLIVIGSHGRGGLARLVLGSVTEGVLRHGTVPVLVARAARTGV